jgi:hypothetical protein
MAGDEKEPEVVNAHDVKTGQEARDATDAEHKMTLREAIQMYPTAIGWAMFFSLGTIMTAFDPQLLGNLYATPAFQKKFGYLYKGSYIVSAPWQTGLTMGNPIGQGEALQMEVGGIIANGMCSKLLGLSFVRTLWSGMEGRKRLRLVLL